MRTLSRPMFNMGGPIKQGIMHGIREPYRGGSRVGAGLVGDPRYPQTGGRARHGYWLIPQALRMIGTQVAKRGLTSAASGEMAKKGIQESIKRAAGSGGASNVAKAAAGEGYWARDPTFKALKWAKDAIMSPTAKGWGKSALRGFTSPTGLALTAASTYGFWPDGTPKGPPTDINKPGGYPDAGAVVKEKATLSKAQRDAFALAERNKRVKKYLDLMGYDRSKKTAIADALIDASKIVSERGTLDPKNITQELINPIIQATSKRLDKPDQIREAVGLMMTKAGLEKEMYDAKPGTIAKNVQDMVKSGKFTEEEAWAVATKGSQGAVADIQGAIATGKVTAAAWPSFLRATGAQHGEPVTVVTAEDIKNNEKLQGKSGLEIITEFQQGDGLYMIDQAIFQVKDGKPTQIV